jgi:hypothetical protein
MDGDEERTPELALMRQQRPAGKKPSGNQLGRKRIVTRRLVTTADGSIWADQLDTSPEITFQHTVLCQVSLPYHDPGDDIRRWQRGQGAVRLEVEAGRAYHPRVEDYVDVGLPFGPKPRLVLAFLNSYALRHHTPEIDVGNSLTKFVKDIGLCLDGRSIRMVKDQLARLSAAEIRMAFVSEKHVHQVNTHVVGEFDLWFPKDERQRVLWPSTVVLDPRYYDSLTEHAVPLDRSAIGRLADSAVALDMYAWLAQRLYRISYDKPAFIAWPALKAQFGAGYARIRKFRERFEHTLRRVLDEYRTARVEVDDRGMTLRFSPPPIPGRRWLQITTRIKEPAGN